MRLHISLGTLLVAGSTLPAACGDNGPSQPHLSPAQGTGGSQNGRAGKGGGGTLSGAAGGDGGSSSGAAGDGAGGESGRSGTGGRGGSSTTGAAGQLLGGDIGADGGAPGAGGTGGQGGNGDLHRLYVGPGGYDAGPGTRSQPFATLAQAASVAVSGDTIVFLDGNFALPKLKAPIVVPDGVDIVADNQREVSLVASGGTLLELAGNTRIDGINFDGFDTVVHAVASDGAVSVTNSSFLNCAGTGTSALEVGGSASVALVGGSSQNWGNCAAFGHAYGQGTLSVDGGLVHFTTTDTVTVFTADDTATLQLSNLIATDGNRPVLLLNDSSEATVEQSTLSTLGSTVITLNASASLEVTNSDLSIAAGASSVGACIASNLDGSGSIALARSIVHDCSAGVRGTAPAVLSVTGTDIYAMSENGLDFPGGQGGVIDITDSSLRDIGSLAARLGGSGAGAQIFQVTVRGTTIASVPYGFALSGAASSTWDLGTLAAAGENVLTATTTSLQVLTAAGTFVAAVGNTWAPGVQSADGSGQYAAVGAGAVLEVTDGAGQNYSDDNGATLRLAENP